MPDKMPDGMSEFMPDRMPDGMSEYLPDKMPDGISECMSDRMSLGGDHSKKATFFVFSMFGPFSYFYFYFFYCLDMLHKHNVSIIVGFSSSSILEFDFFMQSILSPILFLVFRFDSNVGNEAGKHPCKYFFFKTQP